ncbi:MAG: hypothetical protein MJ138_00145 [Kiritimatiellae bacterium]|nr:hypothetical protein [Kiritimatiellia bacterium]
MNKRGSALLIVLGVMAFVTASVVSFAVYMRESRLPSTFFRRAMAERQFVKAALAYAIDEIDAAVGDDPFPGVGKNVSLTRDGSLWGTDVWKSRVLMPFGTCDWSNTVSVLTLEGLGYLPPAIVNEVRWGARCTTNAVWRGFNYDLGRYAFVAVNVSDFLDVNKLHANTNRSVGAPISLGALLSREGSFDDPEIPASDFDYFLSRRGNNDPMVAFTSMMDYNLACNFAQDAKIKRGSPFGNMIRNWTSSSDSWYAGMTSNDVVRQAFITDTWFPKTNSTWRVDLDNPAHQPFALCGSWFPGDAPGKTSLSHCYNIDYKRQPWAGTYFDTLPIIATGMLCDYLDSDSVPLSLAMPCTEIAPMVVGIEAGGIFNFRLGVKKTPVETGPAKQDGEEPDEINEYTHTLCFAVDPEINVTCAFPFRRVANRLKKKSFSVQCVARLFFTDSSGATWTDGGLRIPFNNPDANRLCLPEAPFTWPTRDMAGRGGENPPPCITFVSDKQTVDAPDCSTDEEDVVLDTLSFSFSPSPYTTGMSANGDRGLELAKYQYNETSGKYVWPLDADGNLTDEVYQNAFRLYKSDWTFAKIGDGGTFRPSLAVWVRISDSDNATVDLVPAHVHYDSINNHNDHTDVDMPDVWRTCANNIGDRPLLRFFTSGVDLKFDRASLLTLAKQTGTLNATFDQSSYYCCDPRYNYAPEDWVAFAPDNDPQKDPAERWLDEAVHPVMNDGLQGRDRDVFMFVSNQGYLQSPYELMFIPRLKPFPGNEGDPEWGEFMMRRNFDGVVRTSPGALADADVMWRSYLPPALGGEDDFGLLRMHECASEEAFRVNPYGDSRFVALALANTPYDWFAAGTNAQNLCCSSERTEKRTQFEKLVNGLQRSFCTKSMDDASRWTFEETQALGQRFSEFFRRSVADASIGSWLAAYDSLDWGGKDQSSGASQALNPGDDPLEAFGDDLTFADRKFLYAFWRNCFVNRQQLFLVFVRAEMNTISINDKSRRGIRAVALVWRDPAIPTPARNGGAGGGYKDMADLYLLKNGGEGSRPDSWRTWDRSGPPHRTRVLFYHQFE